MHACRSTDVFGYEHLPAEGPAIVVANHVSECDSALLASALGRNSRTRGAGQDAPPQELALPRPVHFDDYDARLRRGELIAIFPEGAPARTGSIETFHPEVETLIAAHPSATVLACAICPSSGSWSPAVLIGAPLRRPLTAAQIRRHVVELSTEAIELTKTPDDTLAHRFITTARANWDRPAIADSTATSLTYGETLTRAMLLGEWLRQTRAGEERIGISLAACVEAAIANYAITLAGKAAVNLNFTAGESNCRLAIEQCELKTILTSRGFLQRAGLPEWPEMAFLEDIHPAFTRGAHRFALSKARDAHLEELTAGIHPDSTACILFSSGSTGIPKGVELTHWNILCNATGCAWKLPPAHNDCLLGVLPFFHSFGYTFTLWFPALNGFRGVYHSNPTDAKIIGDLAQAHQATYFPSTPTFCQQYARKIHPAQFATLKYILVGAEKLRDTVAEEFRRVFGIDLLAGYGCTELGPGVAINTPDVEHHNVLHRGSRAGSVGRPLTGISIRIADPETYEPVPAGRQGMVLVKGPSRMPGYFRAPEKTAEVLRDGYYITGDLGYIDDDGFLYITDRIARFSKVGGEMVPHLRIEQLVSDVTPCFVTGIPDDRRGERLTLLYTNSEISPDELCRRLSASGLPALWIPKRENIHLVGDIPVLASGKVNLRQARELAIAAGRDR